MNYSQQNSIICILCLVPVCQLVLLEYESMNKSSNEETSRSDVIMFCISFVEYFIPISNSTKITPIEQKHESKVVFFLDMVQYIRYVS